MGLENTAAYGFPVLAFLLLAACAAPLPEPRPAPPPVAAPLADWLPACAELEIRVFRDGPLAALGHDHVITSTVLHGGIHLTEPLHNSRFELSLPLESLVVDDPAARAAAGAIFSRAVPDADRSATRQNLLGPTLLDADRNPQLRLHSVAIRGGPQYFEATTDIELRGTWHRVQLPIEIERTGRFWRIQGTTLLSHAELGLTPFSVALGALRVAEDIELGFTLLAIPVGEDPAQVQCPQFPGAPP